MVLYYPFSFLFLPVFFDPRLSAAPVLSGVEVSASSAFHSYRQAQHRPHAMLRIAAVLHLYFALVQPRLP
jgi:hypothetical protein